MAKRGAGEGSVYKRGNSWVAQVGSGKNREYRSFKTQREANSWRLKAVEQRRQGLDFAGSKVTLAKFLDDWLVVARSSVRPNTYYQYAQIVRDHINPTLGKVLLKDLRPEQVQSLYTSKLKNGVSPRTTRMIHAVIRRALNHALQLGSVIRNVSALVTPPKVPKKEMQILDEYQVRQLIQATERPQMAVLFWMAVTTGLRQGEILGLKWSDLDWDNRRIHVQRQIQRRKGEGLVFCEPKSSSGRRVIVLGQSTIEKLRSHKNRQEKERMLKGNEWQENDLIFPSPIGTPLDSSNVVKAYKRSLEKAGLPNIRFHDLRHTAATLMLQEGINPKIVQERLGHADISLTLNTYSHVLPHLQEEAAEKMDELLTLIDVSDELEVIKKT
ncbi:MAG: site-specific integrase [Chloroflexi bacterium]|nr:site-specific integrase [Chloroflexota bacterium]